jgi:2-amino-4-hydroxy-6-hydroxymethyldihydropteridine diphosphokinase
MDNLRRALAGLRASGLTIRKISAVYETEPVGFLDQPWFLNLAVEVESRLSPGELLACCMGIEAREGRVRTFTGAPRTLDLDILLMGRRILEEPGLRIPHPRMAERRFVLVPLAEIAPGTRHPERHQTIRSLLAICPDHSKVTRYSEMS